VKNWRKTIIIAEKFDLISRLERGEGVADSCHNVRPAYISLRTVRYNADRNKENDKS
jgi:hypothetical protein